MKMGTTRGIKVRTATDKHVQLVNRETGRWLANIRWRPCGTIYVELAADVRKEILTESVPPKQTSP